MQSSSTHLITPSRNFVEVRWRSLFEVLPLASGALLTTLHPLLENVLQTFDHFKISSIGAPFSWLEKPRNRRGRDLNWILCSAWKKWISGTPLEHPPYSPDVAPCDLWAFTTMKMELRGKKTPVPLSSWSLRLTVRSTFSRSGWSVVRSASLAKGGTWKRRASPHLHKVPTRSNKVSPRTLQTALVALNEMWEDCYAWQRGRKESWSDLSGCFVTCLE
jgi:hypothetical protein